MKPATIEVDYLERPFDVPRKYVDVRRTNRHQMNWIHRAAAAHYWKDISSVLSHIHGEGAALVVGVVDQRDVQGQTPLYHACIKDLDDDRLMTIRALLNNQAAFRNQRNEVNGWTMAHWLAYNDGLESLKFMENNGMCCFLPDHKGNFPIDVAGLKGNVEVVVFLINNFLALRKRALSLVNEEKKKNIAVKKTWSQDLPKRLGIDEYHDYFLASDYLYTVVTYWALYYNRSWENLLPRVNHENLESIGDLLALPVSVKSNEDIKDTKVTGKENKDNSKDDKDTVKTNKNNVTDVKNIEVAAGTDRADTEVQKLKDSSLEGLLLDKIPPLTMRIPTLGFNNLFHAASASDTDQSLITLFKLIPKYAKQEIQDAYNMLYIPENHPFHLDFLKSVVKEQNLIKKDRTNTIVPNQPGQRAFLGLNDWESTNDLKETPLHVATRRCQPHNVKLLLDQGADFLATNTNYWTPPNLAMNELTIKEYVEWFKKLRLTHLKGTTYYLKRSWIEEKTLIKKTGCLRRRPKVYVDNLKEKIHSEVGKLSANMLFNTESSTFYYLAFRIKVNPAMRLEDKMQAAERADFIIDILVNLGYRATLVSSTVPESYLLLVHASNDKLRQV